MSLDGVVPSPRRRPLSNQSSLLPSTLSKKQVSDSEEFNSWSALYKRHQFLLVALVLLGFLCIIYLYFAITLGAAMGDSCYGLTGTQKALCRLEHAKTMAKGKMKFI